MWRNALNNADLVLTVNASNQLTFNGSVIGTNLAVLTSAHLFVGNGSNVPTDVAVSGDLTLANTGAFTIANSAVTNAKVSASAAIAYSKLTLTGSIVDADISASAAIAITKLANGTADQVLGTNHTATGTEWKTITATGNTVVTGGVGTVTIDTIQAIQSSSSPTFSGLLLLDSTTHKITLQAPSSVTAYTIKLPGSQGSNGQAMVNDGSGNLSWGNAAAAAGGSNTQLQYNSSNSLAGTSGLTWDGTTLSFASGKVISVQQGGLKVTTVPALTVVSVGKSSTSTQTSSLSATFVDTTLTITVTQQFANSQFEISVSGVLGAGVGSTAYATLTRNSIAGGTANLIGTMGYAACTSNAQTATALTYFDTAPAAGAGNTVTYKVQIRTDNGAINAFFPVNFGGSNIPVAVITVKEYA